MTVKYAISILLTNDLQYFYEQVPIGAVFEEVIKEVIEVAVGNTLDYIAQTHFGTFRAMIDQRGQFFENDSTFRERILFRLGFSNETKTCIHSWTIYDSGWSKYEFCSKCDVKKT